MKKYVLTLVTLSFLGTTLSGCASSLMYDGYYEPFADSGGIPQEMWFDRDCYPDLPNSILFSDIGVEISCINDSLFFISSGPVLWPDPLLTLPIIPLFLPLPYIPKGIWLKIDFTDQVKSVELDPRSITLLTEDEGIAKPQSIAYRVGATEFVKTPPMTEPIVIEDASRMDCIDLFFEQSARRTSSFVFTIGNLKINHAKVNLPRIMFRKERNLSLCIGGD